MTSLPLPLAVFIAGLISFLSPCVLPLVPGYVSLISGVGVEQLKLKEGELFRKVMLNSAAFIVGFSIVFITLGAISTEVGQVLAQYKSLLARIAGVVIILFGLHLTGIFQIKALLADTRLHSLKGSSSAWGAFVIGFAADQDKVWKGIFLLAIYSAGLAVPFLLTSLGIERFLKFYNRFKFHMHAVEVASGVLLIALGILLVMGRFALISGYFSFLNKFAL